MKRSIILASQSKRRKDLLESLGFDVTIDIPEVEEIGGGEDPAALVEKNAELKVEAVQSNYSEGIILGSDTIIWYGGHCVGKPDSKEDAIRILSDLKGGSHDVYTGVCLMNAQTGVRRIFHDKTIVTFKPVSEEEIRNYVDKVNTLDKAGAYAIQEYGEDLVERYEGSYTNIVGLPTEKLEEEYHLIAN